MKKRRHLAGVVAGLMLVAAMALPGIASAHEGEYEKFNNCPSTNTEVKKCLYAVTEGGEVVLGSKTVPIVNPVVLQGGYGAVNNETHYSKFFAATNGVTLSKAPQPVPGGLAGLINCKEISNFILRTSCEWTFENGLTGVNSTLELARPASEIKISELYQIFQSGPALIMPVKFHLENPFLGSGCYVGSESSPVWWNLTTGTTSPTPPAEPISGATGSPETTAGGVLNYTGTVLVDNNWSAPGANGCGGPIVEYLLDPIINLSSGVPSAAGKNKAVLDNSISTVTTRILNQH